MAINWEVFIDIQNMDKHLVRVRARRVNDVTNEVWEHVFYGVITTAQQRSDLLNQIKDEYLVYENREVQADSFLAGLEDTAANDLNNWELTR